jgi:hypothetical protein
MLYRFFDCLSGIGVVVLIFLLPIAFWRGCRIGDCRLAGGAIAAAVPIVVAFFRYVLSPKGR